MSPPGDLTAKDLRWQHRFGVTHGIWMESDDIRGTEVLAELADPVLGRIFRHFKQVSQGACWRLTTIGALRVYDRDCDSRSHADRR